MRASKTIQIESFTYQLTQLGAVQGRQLVLQCGKLLASLAPLMLSGGKLDAEALEGLSAMFERLDSAQLEPLWNAFSENALVVGKDGKSREKLSDVFDDHFAGEYFAMVKFFVEAAKLNFGDFFEKALAQASASVGDLSAATPSASKSPRGSTGTSGA